jgi:hypothetical protein
MQIVEKFISVGDSAVGDGVWMGVWVRIVLDRLGWLAIWRCVVLCWATLVAFLFRTGVAFDPAASLRHRARSVIFSDDALYYWYTPCCDR